MSCSDMDGCEVERDLRARLAAVEAERDQALNDCHHVPALAEAEARLAEVEALCDRTDPFHAIEFITKVRAAARGEDDRNA